MSRFPILGQPEGDGVVCLYRIAHHSAGIAVHPRGDVEAEHGLAALIDHPDRLGVEPGHFPVDAGAEQGVDDGVAP